MKPTLYERTLAKVAPGLAMKAYHARVSMSLLGNSSHFTRGQHSGARSESKMLRFFNPRAQSADEDNLGDLETLRARSYDLQRSSPLADGAVQTLRNMVVGTGLMPQPRIDYEYLGIAKEEAKEAQKNLKRMWWLHAGCTPGMDITERFNFPVQEAIGYASLVLGGDVLMIRRWNDSRRYTPFGTCIQLVESYRIRTPADLVSDPNIRMGVKLGKNGEHLGYYVQNTDLTRSVIVPTKEAFSYVPAIGKSGERQAVLIQNPLRVGETRGVPLFASSIESFRGMQEILDNELLASLLNSMLTFYEEVPAPAFTGSGPTFGGPVTAAATEAATGQTDTLEATLGGGTLIRGKPGHKLGMYNPMRPNDNLGPYINVITSSIAPALGMSQSFLVKKFEKSYSAARAEGQETWRGVFPTQELMISQMCNVAYGWWLDEVMMSAEYFNVPDYFDDLFVREAWSYCDWPGPVPTSLDPYKEAQANKLAKDEGWTSNAQIAARQYGNDWDVVQDALSDEKEVRDELGLTPAPPPASPFGGDPDDPDPEEETDDDEETEE